MSQHKKIERKKELDRKRRRREKSLKLLVKEAKGKNKEDRMGEAAEGLSNKIGRGNGASPAFALALSRRAPWGLKLIPAQQG